MNSTNINSEYVPVKVYKRRYLMLLLSSVISGLISFQTFEYTSISNVVADHYKVSNVVVTFTSLSGNVAYAVFFFVGIYFLGKYGIAVCLVAGAALNAFGACIKCFSLNEDTFYVLVIGQILPAMGQTFTAPLSALLAAVWFRNNELATVVGVNYAFQTLGSSASFLIAILLFDETFDEQTLNHNFERLSVITATVSTVAFMAVAIFIEDKPPIPPSYAQKCRQGNDAMKSKSSNLVKNKSYISLIICFVINITVNTMVTILLNQLLLSVFPNDIEVVTITGIIFTASGLLGSLIIPYLLDKFKKFKLISVLMFISSLWFLSAFAWSLYLEQRLMIYISMFGFGVVIMGFTSIAADIAVDLTYPCPENTSVGFMYFFSAIPSIILAPLASQLIETLGVYPALGILSGLLVVGTLLLLCSKWTLRRQDMEEKKAMLDNTLYTDINRLP